MKQSLIFILTIFLTAHTFSSVIITPIGVPRKYFVDASRPDDSGDGDRWETAKKTIQAAVDLTSDGDTVWVTNGTYLLSAEISVTNAITICSINGPEVTVVDGVGSNRCFNLTSNCFVSGFTITGGWAFDKYEISGGGVYCADASSIVSNCVISENIVFSSVLQFCSGGGMYGGTAYNCIFSGNAVWGDSSYGGGLCSGVAYGCVFNNNSANEGGGMSGGVASNCTFLGNSAEGSIFGGGFQPFGGGGMSDGTAYNCTFTSNSANWSGGAMERGVAYNSTFNYNFSSWGGGGGLNESTAYGCVFRGNSTSYAGGGMAFSTSYYCTFVGNNGSSGGGGIASGIAYNSVFSGNTGGEREVDMHYSTAYNSCSVELTNDVNGNITNAPLFVDAANEDFRLQSNSPCINWGNNAFVANAADLDGNPRIVEGTVDMGAYEYQGTVGLADSDFDGINDDWERSFGGNQNPDGVCSNGVNTIFQAYVAGLDPNDPQSKFTAAVSGQTLRWNATSGRVYAVYYSTNLLDGFQPLETNIPWTAGCFTDSSHNAGQRFYRIEVRKP